MEFGLAAQLRQRHDGDAELLGEHLEPTAYLADLDRPVLKPGAVGRG